MLVRKVGSGLGVGRGDPSELPGDAARLVGRAAADGRIRTGDFRSQTQITDHAPTSTGDYREEGLEVSGRFRRGSGADEWGRGGIDLSNGEVNL